MEERDYALQAEEEQQCQGPEAGASLVSEDKKKKVNMSNGQGGNWNEVLGGVVD